MTVSESISTVLRNQLDDISLRRTQLISILNQLEVENVKGDECYMEIADKLPELAEPEAYAAVYGGDTLVFGRGDEVPGEYNGKVLNESWRGIETSEYTSVLVLPWTNYRQSIATVCFDSIIKPTSTRLWFSGASNLLSVENIDMLDTSKVIDMSYMFNGCKAITSLDVSKFNTSNNTLTYSMFYGCSALTSIDVSNFDTSKVIDMGGMFNGCKAITNLDVSNFNTGNVISTNGMFVNCNLTTLDLSSFDTSNVTDMGGMFRDCSSLTTIYVSSLWTTLKTTKHSNMFNGCTKLVGGNGTAYSRSYRDKTYARIDGGASSPGYFTSK